MREISRRAEGPLASQEELCAPWRNLFGCSLAASNRVHLVIPANGSSSTLSLWKTILLSSIYYLLFPLHRSSVYGVGRGEREAYSSNTARSIGGCTVSHCYSTDRPESKARRMWLQPRAASLLTLREGLYILINDVATTSEVNFIKLQDRHILCCKPGILWICLRLTYHCSTTTAS
jgi:hypothetical protein